MTRFVRSALPFLAFVFLPGCALVLGIEDTEPGFDDDDGGSGGSDGTGGANGSGGGDATGGMGGTPTTVGPEWSCIEDGAPPTTTKDEIVATITVTGLDATTPIEGLDVVVCTRTFGTSCANSEVGVTDAAGQVELTLPTDSGGFQGYIDISGSGVQPDILNPGETVDGPVQALRWIYTRARVDDFSMKVLVPSKDFWENVFVSSTIGGPAAANTGYLTFAVLTCDETPAAGVSLALTPRGESSLFYTNSSDNFISEDIQTSTFDIGRGGFFDVAPGQKRLTGTIEGTDVEVVSVDAEVKSEMITYVEIAPEHVE